MSNIKLAVQTPATTRAFWNSSIIFDVLQYLPPRESRNFALVSRTWTDPALRVLYRDVDFSVFASVAEQSVTLIPHSRGTRLLVCNSLSYLQAPIDYVIRICMNGSVFGSLNGAVMRSISFTPVFSEMMPLVALVPLLLHSPSSGVAGLGDRYFPACNHLWLPPTQYLLCLFLGT